MKIFSTQTLSSLYLVVQDFQVLNNRCKVKKHPTILPDFSGSVAAGEVPSVLRERKQWGDETGLKL